jgi:hypothetical protein
MPRMMNPLDRLEQRRPVPTPRTYDLSRLTDVQLERLAVLAERIKLDGPDGLTPDDMVEMADLMAGLEEGTACLATC